MSTIEGTLARDFLRRGAIILPLVFLAFTTIPLWILQFLLARAVLDPREGVMLHVTLTMIMAFGAAVGVVQAQGALSRFFPRPISASRLVCIQMTLGIATIALMYALAASLLNLGGAGWPVLGPTLFVATALACATAAIWSLEGSPLAQMFGCVAVVVPLAVWFSRCYGATSFGDWKYMWQTPTAGDVLTLIGLTAAAYVVAAFGVARVRTGNVWDFAAVRAWWDRLRASGSEPGMFRSSLAAQAWSEWREKLAFAPAVLVAAAMLAILAGWALGWVPPQEIGPLALGLPVMVLTVVLPFILGLMAGNCARPGKPEMRPFLATRPVTDGFLARAILTNCLTGLIAAWCMWGLGLVVLAGTAQLIGQSEPLMQSLAHPSLELMKVPVAIFFIPLASWIFTTLTATLAACGRTWLWATVLWAVLGFALVMALGKEFVSPRVFDGLWQGVLALAGLLYVALAIWALQAAVRRTLISWRTVLLALAAWVVAAIGMVVLWKDPNIATAAWLWHSIGFLGLAVLPCAALPLAVRWNRHR